MGNNHEDRMNAIKDFFANISDEDLKKVLIKAGAGCIKESYKSNYVLAMKNYSYSSMCLPNKKNRTLNEYTCDDALRSVA